MSMEKGAKLNRTFLRKILVTGVFGVQTFINIYIYYKSIHFTQFRELRQQILLESLKSRLLTVTIPGFLVSTEFKSLSSWSNHIVFIFYFCCAYFFDCSLCW